MSSRNIVADGLVAIKNAQKAKKQDILLPTNKLLSRIAQILKDKNYVSALEKVDKEKKNCISIVLKYDMFHEPCIQEIKCHSKSSRRVYVDKDSIPRIRNGFATVIISTSKGVMTGYEARERGLGGELVCHIF